MRYKAFDKIVVHEMIMPKQNQIRETNLSVQLLACHSNRRLTLGSVTARFQSQNKIALTLFLLNDTQIQQLATTTPIYSGVSLFTWHYYIQNV